MKLSFFAKFILIAFGVLVMAAAAFFVLMKKPAVYQEQSKSPDYNQILSQLEKDIRIGLETGGIHPDLYSQIDKQLKEIEDRNIEPERTSFLRNLMSDLSVGGQKIGQNIASIPSEPSTKPPADKSQTSPQSAPAVQKSSGEASFQNPPATAGQASNPVDSPNNPAASGESCKNNAKPVFTHHITDVEKVNYVVPPPTIGAGPSLKTHGYIGTDHARVPVYAPIDMVLNTGAYFEGGPYWLGFEVSCEVTLRFGHMTEPIQAVRDLFPSTPAAQNDSRDQQIKNKIPFKAGDLIGYTSGTSLAGNWDMGVYNSTTSNKYKGDPTWGNSWVYTTAVCPFDYFLPELKAVYYSKFDSQAMAGNPRDGESFCQN